MKATLVIEAIGDNARSPYGGLLGAYLSIPPRYWVARISGRDPRYKWQRQFLRGLKDYSKSNSVGSRGIMVTYLLDSGHVYEVKQPVSWKRSEHYYCRVTGDGGIVRIADTEVDSWLTTGDDGSALTF